MVVRKSSVFGAGRSLRDSFETTARPNLCAGAATGIRRGKIRVQVAPVELEPTSTVGLRATTTTSSA